MTSVTDHKNKQLFVRFGFQSHMQSTVEASVLFQVLNLRLTLSGHELRGSLSDLVGQIAMGRKRSEMRHAEYPAAV